VQCCADGVGTSEIARPLCLVSLLYPRLNLNVGEHLVSDAGIRGLVVRLRGGHVARIADDRIRADAGVTISLDDFGQGQTSLGYLSRLPLHELLKSDLPTVLKDVVGTARLVASERLGDVATDHIALRGATADMQLWIPRDGDPLPKRIVITYRLAGGQPRFEADLGPWNLAPDVPDSLFTFTPAAGAERIPVLAPRRGKAR